MTDGRLRDNKARRQKGRREKKGIETKGRTGKKKCGCVSSASGGFTLFLSFAWAGTNNSFEIGSSKCRFQSPLSNCLKRKYN